MQRHILDKYLKYELFHYDICLTQYVQWLEIIILYRIIMKSLNMKVTFSYSVW